MLISQTEIIRYGTDVPYANVTKYIGMTLDIKLHWKVYVKKVWTVRFTIQENVLPTGQNLITFHL